MARLSIGPNGELTQRDGTVVGFIDGISLHGLICANCGQKLGVGVKGEVESQSQSQSLTPTPTEDSQTAMLPDPIDETWELYVTLLEKPRMQLLPKYRKWIRDAHASVGVDRTRDAIRGLAASQYHREHNYTGIEYALRPKQNESIEGRIDKMAAYATVDGSATTQRDVLARFAPDTQQSIYGYVNDISRSLRDPEAKGLKDTADWCWRHLERMGLRPTFNDEGRFVAWEELTVEQR